MKTPALLKSIALILLLWLAGFSLSAHAAINNAGLLDNVLNSYSTAASAWSATITSHASWLFWTLALISMVWTFGMLALRKADIGEFFAEFIRFTIFTGFFWWLLLNGPNFATSIMTSLRTIGGNATGLGPGLAPSGIVDIGFDIFFKVLSQSSVWSPVDSAAGIIISAAILVILALIGVNMLLLLISGWILAFAGVFFLGFGGSRWTSDMAINYFKTVLSIAAQLLTMVLLVGIGKSFVDQYYLAMSSGISLKELGVMLIVAVVLLALVNKVPPMVGGLAMGGGAGGGGFGAGAAMGAAAVATAGAALATGAANMAGGAQAVMAAFSKANASESADGGGTKDFMSAASGGGSDSGGGGSGGGSALAVAMGDSGGGSSDHGSFGGGSSSGGAPGEQKSGGMASAAAKVGRVAAGTAANLAQGSWDVAKAKAGEIKGAALDRIGETTGGKIATAIKTSSNQEPVFSGDSLGEGKGGHDANEEVAAFTNRTNGGGSENDTSTASGASGKQTGTTTGNTKSVFD